MASIKETIEKLREIFGDELNIIENDFEVLKELEITCKNCNSPVYNIIKISEEKYKFPVGNGVYKEVENHVLCCNCPFCDESVEKVIIGGTVRFSASDGAYVDSIDMDLDIYNNLVYDIKLKET